jgi:2-hydroxy-6-oxonona-2,4-dienedioate hydrolase
MVEAFAAAGPSAKTSEPSAKDATVFSYRIHYLEAGRGAPVILLHGTGGEGARWMPTIEGLAPHARVIAPDQIGFGQSMGAGVALFLAVHHPDTVERLVLVDGGGFRSADDPPSPPPNWRDRQLMNSGALEESREYLKKMYFDHSFIIDKMVEENLILRLRSAYTIESMQIANSRGLGGVTEEEVRAIAAPTLLVWGKNDPLSPVENADKLQAAIKNSRKVLIDKAGHYPFLEHADEFNRVVVEFLNS